MSRSTQTSRTSSRGSSIVSVGWRQRPSTWQADRGPREGRSWTVSEVTAASRLSEGPRWLWIGGAIVAFVIATVVGVLALGTFGEAPDPELGYSISGANSFALILAIAFLVALLAYAALEYMQTKRLASIARQFDTRTLVLMPVAIAFNIILGQAVGAALK